MFETRINSTELFEGQFVVVKTIKIDDGIVTAELIEYNGLTGLIMPNELSRKRIKTAIQATKVGKTEVCQILKIDGNNIDLSLKQVDEEEKAGAMDKFKQNKLAYTIAEKIAKKNKIKPSDVYKYFNDKIEQSGSLINYFAMVKENLSMLDLTNDIENALNTIIKQEFKASTFKMRADIDVNCYKYDGLQIIKDALVKGQEIDEGVEICLLNTPTFSITKTCTDKKEGSDILNKVIETIQEAITMNGGTFHLMSAPRVFGEKTKHNLLKTIVEEKSEASSETDSE